MDQGLPGGRLDLEAKLDGETDSTEKAKTILRKTGDWVADGTDKFCGEIGLSLDVIEELIFERIKEHAVDGEVATFGVLLGGGEGDGGGSAPIVVGAVKAEGGDFENMFIEAEANDAEGFSLRIGSFGEKRLDLVGRGGGGDVDIGVGALQKRIANAPAGIDGHVAGVDKLLHNFFSGGVTNHFFGSGERRVR